MNVERRKLLSKARDLVSEAQSLVSQAAEEERDYFDSMPESLQGGDKGRRAEEVCDSLEEISDNLEQALNDIEGAAE